VSRGNKRVDTFNEAIELQEPVYIWSEYLRLPAAEPVKLIPAVKKTAAKKSKSKKR